MRSQWILAYLLWIAAIVIISGETTRIISSSDSDDESIEEVVRETLNSGRGHRDEPGVRDQWNTGDHIGEASRFDSRRSISPDVKRLLQRYRLECPKCDHYEAMSMINEFVQAAKMEQKRQVWREKWTSRSREIGALVTLICAVVCIRYVALSSNEEPSRRPQDTLIDEKKQHEIQELQRQQIVHAAVQRHTTPTWRDNEEKEVWTAKQEKQFQKALGEFGGVPKKERYLLIAAKVPGKSRIECLTHHRIQQLKERE